MSPAIKQIRIISQLSLFVRNCIQNNFVSSFMELSWICVIYVLMWPYKSTVKGICNVGVYIPVVKLGEVYDLTNQFNGQTVECRKTLYFPGAVSLTINVTNIILPVVKRVEYIGINTGQRQTAISSHFNISSGECDGAYHNSVSIKSKSVLKFNNTEYVCLQYLPPEGLDQSGPLYGDYGPHPLKINLQMEITAVVCDISDLLLRPGNSTSLNSSCFMVCTNNGGHYQQCQATSPHMTTLVASTEHVTSTSQMITDHTVQQIIPVHQQSSPAHQQSSPAHQQSSLAHQQSSLAHQQTSPAHQQSSPAHQQSSPAHQQTSPAHHQSSPAHQQSSPAHQQTSPAHQQSPIHPITTSVDTKISAHPQSTAESITMSLQSKTPKLLKSTTTDSSYNTMPVNIKPTTSSVSPSTSDSLYTNSHRYKTTTKVDHVLRSSTRSTDARSSNYHSTLVTTSPTPHTMLTHKNGQNIHITSSLTRMAILTGGHHVHTSLSTKTLTPHPGTQSGKNTYRTASQDSNSIHHGLTTQKTSDVTHTASNTMTVSNIITSTVSKDNTNDLLIGLYTTSGLAALLFILLIICCCCSCSKGRQPTVLNYSGEDMANMSGEGVHVCGQWKTNWIMKPKYISRYSLQKPPKLRNTAHPSENDLVTNPRRGDRLLRLQSCGSQTTDKSCDITHNSIQQNEESVYDNIGVIIPRIRTESVRSDIQTQTDFHQNQTENTTSMSSENNQNRQTEISTQNVEMDECGNKTQINVRDEDEEKQILPIKRHLSSMYSKIESKHV